MKLDKSDPATVICAALTALVIIVDIVLLSVKAPADSWYTFDNLDHIGSFLSGSLTPIAIAWAARSLLLQREESRRAAREALEALEASIRATEPVLSVTLVTTDTSVSAQPHAQLSVTYSGHQPAEHRIKCVVRKHGTTDNVTAARGAGPVHSPTTRIVVPFPENTAVTATTLDVLVFVCLKRIDGRVSAYLLGSTGGFTLKTDASVTGLEAPAWDSLTKLMPSAAWPGAIRQLFEQL